MVIRKGGIVWFSLHFIGSCVWRIASLVVGIFLRSLAPLSPTYMHMLEVLTSTLCKLSVALRYIKISNSKFIYDWLWYWKITNTWYSIEFFDSMGGKIGYAKDETWRTLLGDSSWRVRQLLLVTLWWPGKKMTKKENLKTSEKKEGKSKKIRIETCAFATLWGSHLISRNLVPLRVPKT